MIKVSLNPIDFLFQSKASNQPREIGFSFSEVSVLFQLISYIDSLHFVLVGDVHTTQKQVLRYDGPDVTFS